MKFEINKFDAKMITGRSNRGFDLVSAVNLRVCFVDPSDMVCFVDPSDIYNVKFGTPFVNWNETIVLTK